MKKVIGSVMAAGGEVKGVEVVCTPQYGGGVVCGAHTAVDTGLATSFLFQVAAGLFLAGLILFFISRKLRRVYLLE